MNDTLLRCSGLSKSYGGVAAVKDLSLEVSKGELLVVLGPSGCGKTTTLRLLAGFESPDSGAIELSGSTVAGPRTFVPPERRKIGMVFQEYALFPHLTLEKNIGYGLPSVRRAGFSKDPNRQMEQLRLSVRGVGSPGIGGDHPPIKSHAPRALRRRAAACGPCPGLGPSSPCTIDGRTLLQPGRQAPRAGAGGREAHPLPD